MSELFEKEVRVTTLLLWSAVAFAGGGATASGLLPANVATSDSVVRAEHRIDDHEARMRTLESAVTRIETQLESIDSKLEIALR